MLLIIIYVIPSKVDMYLSFITSILGFILS